MTPAQTGPRAEPFFLKIGATQRFCLFHRPASTCRGTVLYIHPFAEELNRSRRMAALQAREMAALGYGVLQLDLYGCGDSSGDFGEARWDAWKQDLAAGVAWLRQQLDQPVTLWGCRLGALLALDYAREARHQIASLILWQPVLKGSAYLTQFLRLRMASAMLGDSGAAWSDTAALREALKAGETVEIAGYDLAPALAAAIDGVDPAESLPPHCPVHWLEAINGPGQGMPPAAMRVINEWQRHGVDLHLYPVHCPPFWATAEITVCTPWIAATTATLQVRAHEY